MNGIFPYDVILTVFHFVAYVFFLSFFVSVDFVVVVAGSNWWNALSAYVYNASPTLCPFVHPLNDIFRSHLSLPYTSKTSNSLYFTPLRIHDAFILRYPNAYAQFSFTLHWTIRCCFCYREEKKEIYDFTREKERESERGREENIEEILAGKKLCWVMVFVCI